LKTAAIEFKHRAINCNSILHMQKKLIASTNSYVSTENNPTWYIVRMSMVIFWAASTLAILSIESITAPFSKKDHVRESWHRSEHMKRKG